MKFNNRVVLITGASTGIGKATAIKFAQNGANANLIYFLASDEASYISGQNIQIDGCRKTVMRQTKLFEGSL